MKLSTVVYTALLSIVVLSTTGVSATETPSRVLKGGKKDKKGKKGKGGKGGSNKGGKKGGKSIKFNFSPPSDTNPDQQYNIRDFEAGVFATSGDSVTFFEPLTDPDDGSNVGTVYGICTVLQPFVTFYCNLTAVYGTSGSFTFGGVSFFAPPPTGGSSGTFTILGAQGDFKSEGTVTAVQAGFGQFFAAEATFE
jgi:hypothetical protein